MHSAIGEFLRPRVVKVTPTAPRHARVVIEPFERGFGHTLGNALRRVLLSSMPGSAISEAEIEGVLHEYTSIEGVQEDVVEILLNLKQVAIRLNAREESELRLSKKGPGPVRAGDIQSDHDVEILNPELVIANLTKAGELTMTLKVERGRGYRPAALDLQRHHELAGLGQVRDHELRVEDLDVVVTLDVAGTDRARALLRQAQLGRLARVEAQRNLLEVQQDLDDVLLDALDAGVFVQHALDLGLGDRAAGHRRQQHAPQRVAERVAETALERLDDHAGVAGGRRRHLDDARAEELANG